MSRRRGSLAWLAVLAATCLACASQPEAAAPSLRPRNDAERLVLDVVERLHGRKFGRVAQRAEGYDAATLEQMWDALGPKKETLEVVKLRALFVEREDGQVGFFGHARFNLPPQKSGRPRVGEVRVELICEQAREGRCIPPLWIGALTIEAN